jgi:hypothetical protein
MDIVRGYEEFVIVRAPRLPSVLRRQLLIGGSAVLAATAFGPLPAAAVDFNTIVGGINAAVGVITNLDSLAGKIWPKVQNFFGSAGSQVSRQTAGRIADQIGDILSEPKCSAVSITHNRTPQGQTGNLIHAVDQQFPQEYVNWCTCHAQFYAATADWLHQQAQFAQQRGDFATAQNLVAKAAADERVAKQWLAKLTPAQYAPVQVQLPPGKVALTPVETHPNVTAQLDEGDYYVTHAATVIDRDSQTTFV